MQYCVMVQLFWNVYVVVGQWYVGGFVFFYGEGYFYYLCLLGVDVGGFGIEGDQFGFFQFFQLGVEFGLVEYYVVVDFGLDRCFCFVVFVGFFGFVQEVVQLVFEFQFVVQGDQCFVLWFVGIQFVDFYVQFDVGFDGCQLIGQECLFVIFFEFCW